MGREKGQREGTRSQEKGQGEGTRRRDKEKDKGAREEGKRGQGEGTRRQGEVTRGQRGHNGSLPLLCCRAPLSDWRDISVLPSNCTVNSVQCTLYTVQDTV